MQKRMCRVCIAWRKKKQNFSLNMNSETLEITVSVVFLGITLDFKLQWNPHLLTLAGYVCK